MPSNLILYRVGARVWIARIMITWGLISAAMLFVTTPTQFYVMRFLLGVAETGFFGPSIIGWAKQATQSTNGGILMLAGFMVLCAVLVLLIPRTGK